MAEVGFRRLQQWRKKAPHSFDEVPSAPRPRTAHFTVCLQSLYPGVHLADGLGIVNKQSDFIVK